MLRYHCVTLGRFAEGSFLAHGEAGAAASSRHSSAGRGQKPDEVAQRSLLRPCARVEFRFCRTKPCDFEQVTSRLSASICFLPRMSNRPYCAGFGDSLSPGTGSLQTTVMHFALSPRRLARSPLSLLCLVLVVPSPAHFYVVNVIRQTLTHHLLVWVLLRILETQQ